MGGLQRHLRQELARYKSPCRGVRFRSRSARHQGKPQTMSEGLTTAAGAVGAVFAVFFLLLWISYMRNQIRLKKRH